MAKAPQTIQEIEAAIEAARAELKVANDKFQRTFNVLNKKYQVLKSAELAATGTLADLLQTYTAMGSNDIGYQQLKDRTEKGEWMGQGLGFHGCYWSETNQYCLTVMMRWGWGATEIQETIKVIDSVMPFVTPGAIKHLPDYKVLNINFGGETKLVLRPDGTWALQSEKSWSKRSSMEGTLEEILQYLTSNAEIGRPHEESDEDEEENY
jgi:hypothetical protein